MTTVKLVSGGVDSYIMSQEYDGLNVYVDFGQKYATEEQNALRKLGVPFETVNVSGGERQDGEQVYIPCRNMTLASLACTLFDADVVMLAGLRDDNCLDKNEQEFSLMGQVLTRYAGKPVKVVSPYFDKSKGEVVYEFRGDKSKLKDTFSCYSPVDGRPCGNCPACLRRAIALETNGIDAGVEIGEQVIGEYSKKIHAYDADRISRFLLFVGRRKKVVAYDLDGTICKEMQQRQYRDAELLFNPPRKPNEYRVIYTSRLEVDREITERWLRENRVPYDCLLMGKPAYATLVDDRATRPPHL